MFNPTTIPELIEYGLDQQISHRTLNNEVYIKDSVTGETIGIPYNAIINKYRDAFKPYVIELPLSENDKYEYWYKPRMLSYKLYGTVEFWSILLYINECSSALEFAKESFKIIEPEAIRRLVNEIFIAQRSE